MSLAKGITLRSAYAEASASLAESRRAGTQAQGITLRQAQGIIQIL